MYNTFVIDSILLLVISYFEYVFCVYLVKWVFLSEINSRLLNTKP